MTTRYEEREVTETRRVPVETTCDKCGGPVEDARSYDTRDFTLEFARGSSYPDGGDAKGWAVEDLCDECVGALRKLLEETGFRVTPIDRSW